MKIPYFSQINEFVRFRFVLFLSFFVFVLFFSFCKLPRIDVRSAINDQKEIEVRRSISRYITNRVMSKLST